MNTDRPGFHDNSAQTAYAVLGFEQIDTGGGCTAFHKPLGAGLSILITRQDDTGAPTEAAEPVTVGLYCEQDSEALAQFNAPDSDAVAYRLSWGLWRDVGSNRFSGME